MDVVLVLAVVALAVLLIAAPLRARAAPRDGGPAADRAELEAAKEAKYREIRDADLDHRTGKLSREDWERLDAALRAEALEILHQIDALEQRHEVSPKQG
jgi:hypothetical protein